MTLYSAQNSGGLTIRNSGGNSFTIQPSTPNNTALFLNPISCGIYPLDCGNLSASQLTLSNSGNSSILTTTATGLNVNDPIVSTGSFTGTQLTLSSGGNSSILTTTANGLSVNDDISGTSLTTTGILTAGSLKIQSPSNDTLTLQSLTNFGLLVSDITGTNGKLTLSNNGSVYASMTCTAQNEFTFSGSTIVSSQTYPLTSSNQTATISYVNQAISSQGGGDASLTATQTFSGVNTFTQAVTIPAQNYNPAGTYGNVAATQEFVQEAILDGTGTSLISVNLDDTTGFSTPAFNFTQTINTKQQTNSYSMTPYSNNNFTIGSQINFTLVFPSFLYPIGATPTLTAGSFVNVYSPQSGQSFNLQMSFLSNTQIRCISGGTTTGGSQNYKITALFNVAWT
jgi:hypothetical protein